MRKKLSPDQHRAIGYFETPLCIVGAAGTGKTTVLARKIATILEEIGSDSILVLCETPRSARELYAWVGNVVGERTNAIRYDIIESVCLEWIRTYSEKLGLLRHFAVFDHIEQLRIIIELSEDLPLGDVVLTPRQILQVIRKLKLEGTSAAQFETTPEHSDYDEQIATVYRRYQEYLEGSQAIDREDIGVLTLHLIRTDPEVLTAISSRFNYWIVDHFEQFPAVYAQILALITPHLTHLTLAGDPDQAVGIELGITGESLRSASQLISSLETIHLDEVFRSSYSVVDISNALRRDRSRSAVGSKSGKGSESVVYFLAFDEHEEARYIIDEITMIRRDELLAQNDFCILYRTQSQALFLEEQLRQNGIRFRSLARSVVYAHSEIRDIILYLRVLFNPADRQAMAQLLALPPFQLTEAEIEPIIRQAAHSASGVFEFTNDDDISDTVKTKMIALIDLINHWRIQIEEDPDTIAGVILAQIADESGYRMLLEEENTLDSLEQLQTIDEFIRTSLENEWSVEQLLNHLAVSHFDDSTEVSGDAVTLLPLRAAKEYEFRCVFVCGLEEGLIPHYNAQFQPDALDEERRLLYIGISRATQHLILTSAFKRSMFGAEWYDDVSRFIKEIPRDRLACFLSDRLAESHEILVEGLRRDGFYIQTWLPSALDLETPRDARFAVGDVIEHQRWGRGVIQSIDGADDNLMLQIQFNDQERKLMAKYADVIKV